MPHTLHASKHLGWARTLKFKVVAMAVVTGVLSAVVTTQLVQSNTQDGIQRMLLRGDSENVERDAALLGSKLDVLQDTLKVVAHHADQKVWQSREHMGQYLLSKPAINVLFENVLAARPDGEMLSRMVRGELTSQLPNIADRAYFQQALKVDQPVVSEPLASKVDQTPIIVMAIAVPGPDGQVKGVMAGALSLVSSRLFSSVAYTQRNDGTRTMVMDRKGVLLAHPNPQRVLGLAAEEPGLGLVFTQWRDLGSPIDTAGSSSMSDGYLVSMAGIPGSDWALVRLTPLAVALEPIASAQKTAWKAAGVVGLLAALLAGGLAWHLTRPITKLRNRTEAMLAGATPLADEWPQDGGEVGALARALQQVTAQREQKQAETQALLMRLEAVLDHADIGIALTRNGHFDLVSGQLCHMLVVDKNSILGKPTSSIHPSLEAYKALSERAYPAFLQHGAFNGEVELLRGNGEKFWAHMRGRAVKPGDRSQGTIWTVQDINEARAHRERLAWTSSHDSLTGLANRPAFEALLQRATEHAAISPFCAMFIDLDHFKQVNDTGGHAAGDAVLRDVAQILVGQVRQTDTVARLGGDEFAVLLGRCPLEQAQLIGEKLRGAVVAYRLDWEGHSFGVGASIGVVRVDARYDTAAEVLRAADAACYRAKQQGRNCVAVYSPDMAASNIA